MWNFKTMPAKNISLYSPESDNFDSISLRKLNGALRRSIAKILRYSGTGFPFSTVFF